jgi:hypothetical protein
VSHFAQYIKSLAIFSEEKQQEIHWLFDSLINSLRLRNETPRLKGTLLLEHLCVMQKT